MPKQQTLAGRVSCTGVGLHSGAPVRLVIDPAPAGSGIVFLRAQGAAPIPALAAAVVSTQRATTLGAGDERISTVEHLLAALYGLGVDNARITVAGPELPVMDGSAAAFVYLLRSAGLRSLAAPRRVLRLRRAVEIREGERWIRAEPADRLRVSCAIDFAHPCIGRQEFRGELDDPQRFERELAGARTFGFLADVDALRAAGLVRGGTLENTVVLDAESVMSPRGLRWPDEFVRHKVLDLLGDLALLGMRLCAHVRAERPGHALHLRLVRALLESDAKSRAGRRAAAQPQLAGRA